MGAAVFFQNWGKQILLIAGGLLLAANTAAQSSLPAAAQQVPVADLPSKVSWEMLPIKLSLDPMTPAEVSRQMEDISKHQSYVCTGWVFLKEGAKLKPIMVKPSGWNGGGGGAIKINGRLRSASATPWSESQHGFGSVIATVSLDPIDSVASYHLPSLPTESGIQVYLESHDVNIVARSNRCTIGKGKCRQYEGTFAAEWIQYDAYNKGRARREPTGLPPLKLVIEDTCPNKRAGLVESYGSRLKVLEWWHQLKNR